MPELDDKFTRSLTDEEHATLYSTPHPSMKCVDESGVEIPPPHDFPPLSWLLNYTKGLAIASAYQLDNITNYDRGEIRLRAASDLRDHVRPLAVALRAMLEGEPLPPKDIKTYRDVPEARWWYGRDKVSLFKIRQMDLNRRLSSGITFGDLSRNLRRTVTALAYHIDHSNYLPLNDLTIMAEQADDDLVQFDAAFDFLYPRAAA